MRVLLLNYEFPPLGGGAATASAQTARHLARQGVEVAVLTSHFHGLPRREERDGYAVYRVPVLRHHLERCSPLEMATFAAGASLPALRLAGSFRPDVLLVYFGVPTGPLGLLVQQLKGIPYLLSLRGGDVPGFMGEELAPLHRLALPVTRLVWRRASALVANSEGLRRLAARTLERDIEVVPNGVDLEAFRPPERAPFERTHVRLLFVGRLVRQKAVDCLLQGIAQLPPDTRERIELEVVGSGPEEERLKGLAVELGLRGIVRFAGWVPRSEIATHYQQADILVLPSLDEGMPNVVLEAMACGLPVLATDISGNRELVSNGVNGCLVPPADPQALARALQRLALDASLQQRMGQASRVRAEQYGWSRVAERYLALARQVVTSRKGSTVDG